VQIIRSGWSVAAALAALSCDAVAQVSRELK
jgi:hypothetical protein